MSENSYLRPTDIRFTQDTISSRFQNGDDVIEAAKAMCSGRDRQTSPAMEVYQHRGKYYSRNNRSLYVSRVAELNGAVATVPVRVVEKSQKDCCRFTTKSDGESVRFRNADERDPFPCH